VIVAPHGLEPGSHVKVRRFLSTYTHHGVYVGRGRVIHFDGEPLRGRSATIVECTLDEFLRGGRAILVPAPRGLVPSEVVGRAERALADGFGAYRLLFRNCEHFATWCTIGRRKSFQVRRGVSLGLMVLGAASGVVLAARRREGSIA